MLPAIPIIPTVVAAATAWITLPTPDDFFAFVGIAGTFVEVAPRVAPYVDDVAKAGGQHIGSFAARFGPYVDDTARWTENSLRNSKNLLGEASGYVSKSAADLGSDAASFGMPWMNSARTKFLGFYDDAAKTVGWKVDDLDLRAASYSREAFAWNPATRRSILMKMSTNPVVTSGDRVTHGRWFNDYTGKYMTDASEVEIDHVIPLKWAWENGASKWSLAQRQKFGNDPLNLRITDKATNVSKGAKGFDEWVPDNPSLRKQYELRWEQVAKKYGLSVPTPVAP